MFNWLLFNQGCLYSRFCAVLFFLIFTISAFVRADMLHLANGGLIEGKVTHVKDGYWLKNGNGRIFFRNDQVTSWEKLPTLDEDYQALNSKIRLDDFNGQMALAKWCRMNNLQQMAKWHYMVAVALRTDDARARRGAGYVYLGGKWVTGEKAMQSKGLIKYKGKWMPAGEAERKRIRDEEDNVRIKVNRDAWKLIRKVARERPEMPLDSAVKKILEMGPLVMFSLERASNDGSFRVRKLVLMVLAGMKDKNSRELLLKRLRVEPTKQLTRLTARLLAIRPDRKEVLGRLLRMAINHTTRIGRHRAWLGLLAAADKRAIDVLVPKVQYCPVSNSDHSTTESKPGKTIIKGQSQDHKASFNGKEYVTGSPKAKKPYYPAHEALVYLTGELLPPDNYAWQNWWEKKRKEFKFRK